MRTVEPAQEFMSNAELMRIVGIRWTPDMEEAWLSQHKQPYAALLQRGSALYEASAKLEFENVEIHDFDKEIDGHVQLINEITQQNCCRFDLSHAARFGKSPKFNT